MKLQLTLAIKINSDQLKQELGRNILESTVITLQMPKEEYEKGWWKREVEIAKEEWLESLFEIMEVSEEWMD